MLIGKLCFSLAWLAWLISVPFYAIAKVLLRVERRLTLAGIRAKMNAPGVARPS
jgi:hypothetical protein